MLICAGLMVAGGIVAALFVPTRMPAHPPAPTPEPAPQSERAKVPVGARPNHSFCDPGGPPVCCRES
jgi:hypothetical protein